LDELDRVGVSYSLSALRQNMPELLKRVRTRTQNTRAEDSVILTQVLLEKYPTAKFKFITNENPDFILSKATKKGLEKKYFDIAAAKRQEVPTELAKIDIGIFFIKPVFSKQASSPVKQGEFMAMGIPVITNSGIGDTDSVIQRYNSGILINDFTLSDYRKAVCEIEKLRTASKINLLKGASEYFSLEYGVETYNTVYAKIFN
jgi:hypothetical protein